MSNVLRQAYALVDRDDRPSLIIFIVSSAISSIIEGIGIAFLYFFFQAVVNPEILSQFRYYKQIHDLLGFQSDTQALFYLSLALIAFFFLRCALLVGNTWLMLKLRRQIQRRMSERFLAGYLKKSTAWHGVKGASRLINNIGQKCGLVTQNMIINTLEMAGSSILSICLFFTAAVLEPAVTLPSAIVIGLIVSMYVVAFRKPLANWSRITLLAYEGVQRTLQELFTGIKTVKVHGIERYFMLQTDTHIDQFLRMYVRQGLAQQSPRYFVELILVSSILAVVAFALKNGHANQSLLPTMLMFGMVAMRLLPQANRLAQGFQYISFARPALDDLLQDTIDLEVADEPIAKPEVRLSSFRHITMRDVSFRHPNSHANALNLINLYIQHGDHIALVGLSGAGKTTLADIFLGLLTPSAGSILVDGVDVPCIPKNLLAYVPQEPFLIKDSLRRNIALGIEDEDVDMVALENSIRLSALTATIERLPRRLDTILGESGAGLSGGERQRVGLARAIYRNADILVLDEPTSALDAMTEADIAASISALKGKKTIILIAHRLSTIKSFDRIMYMEKGRIVNSGDFSSLYASAPNFAHMVDLLSLRTESSDGENDSPAETFI